MARTHPSDQIFSNAKPNLNSDFGKDEVDQGVARARSVLSTTLERRGRARQVDSGSRMLAGSAMRAALNSGPMTPVAGVRSTIWRPSELTSTS